MKSLYLRIYLTVVVALALFALVSGWLVQRHLDEQRLRTEGVAQERAEGVARERAEAWGELLQRALPSADAPVAEQVAGLRDWSQRLRLPMALDDTQGRRVAASESFLRRELNQADMAARLRRIDEQNPRNRGRAIWGHCQSLALYLATQSAAPEIVTAFRQLRRLA